MPQARVLWQHSPCCIFLFFTLKMAEGQGNWGKLRHFHTADFAHSSAEQKHSGKLYSIWQDPATQHTRLHRLLPRLSNTIVQPPTEHNRAQREEKQWLKGRSSSWTSASFIVINRRHNFNWTPREEEEVEFNLPSYEKPRAEHFHLTSLTS